MTAFKKNLRYNWHVTLYFFLILQHGDLELSDSKEQEEKDQQLNRKIGKEQPMVYRQVNINGS